MYIKHTWNSFCDIIFVLSSIELPGLQSAESIRPPSFVGVLHQLIDYVGWGATVNEGPLDHCL